MRNLRHGVLVLRLVACGLVLNMAAATAQPAPLIATADGGCVCHAPLVVGVAKGIFAKYGLNRQIARPATGIEAIVSVQNGSAQDGAAAPGVVAQLNAKGAPVKGLFMAFGDATGTAETDRYLAIVGRRASGLREGHPEDLRGKKVGVPTGDDRTSISLLRLTCERNRRHQRRYRAARPAARHARSSELGRSRRGRDLGTCGVTRSASSC